MKIFTQQTNQVLLNPKEGRYKPLIQKQKHIRNDKS